MKRCSDIMHRRQVRHLTTPSRRFGASAVSLVAALALGTALAACGSSSSSSPGKGNASPDVPAGVKYAQQKVQAAMSEPAAPVPSDSIKNIASLQGKTVYYIPVSADVPAFAITAAAMKTALASVGAKLSVCSGNFNPSGFASCFSQAIGAHAGAIVSDAIPFQITQGLITEASHKSIPVVVTDVNITSPRPTANNIAYIPGADQQYSLAQDWIIADSAGKANVLELEATDSPTSAAGTAQYAIPELKAHCPGCTDTVLKFSSSNEQLLPSEISAMLLKNPKINYIYSEYDQYVSGVLQGVQQASAASRVKVVAAAAALSGLQEVSSGSSVKAEIADNQVYNGWIDADEALRLMAGQAAVNYTIPIRLFTSANVGSIQLTNAAQSSGEWFGAFAYQQQFKTLWGAH
jgi:ribose transport system substrate-binding protein